MPSSPLIPKALINHSLDSTSVYPTLPDSSSTEQIVNEAAVKHVVQLAVSEIAPGESVSLAMWVFGPPDTGIHNVKFLFYYESTKSNPKIR